MTTEQLYDKIALLDTRSAWARGVKMYALDLLEQVEENGETLTKENADKILLNGADSWSEYSWNGCSLIYDEDIAKRLCNPTELKTTKNGERNPNKREQWLDTQARALFQASRLIKSNL